MRLWSIHPSHLDSKGLVALWREGLLAKHVLEGKTKGYKNHPQLERFKSAKHPVHAIHTYLAAVADEATKRGYSFDATKINPRAKAPKMRVTHGQMAYETAHLKKKLAVRDPKRRAALLKAPRVKAHPLFKIVPGTVAPWEKI
jgi:hypothetical protein